MPQATKDKHFIKYLLYHLSLVCDCNVVLCKMSVLFKVYMSGGCSIRVFKRLLHYTIALIMG